MYKNSEHRDLFPGALEIVMMQGPPSALLHTAYFDRTLGKSISPSSLTKLA
jgi:hypothetical protein